MTDVKTRGTVRAWAVLALALCVVAPALRAAEEAASPNPATFLPDSTIVYVQADAWTHWRDSWRKTALCGICNEPEVRAFLEGPWGKIREMLELKAAPGAEAPEGTVDVVLGTLNRLAPGPVVLAMTRGEGAQGNGCALIAGSRGAKDVVDKLNFLQSVVQGFVTAFLKTDLQVIQKTQYQAADLMTVKINAFELTLCVYNDYLIVTSRLELAKQIVDGIAGTLPKTLAASPGFAGTGLAGGEHLCAYLNVAAVRKALGAGPNKAGEALRNTLDSLGLSDMEAITWSVRMDGPAFESRAAFVTGGARKGLLAALDAEPIDPATLKVCRVDAPFCVGMKVQPKQLWSVMENAVKTTDTAALERMKKIKAKLAAQNRNLETEMTEAFGNDVVLTSYSGEAGAMGGMVASLSVKDDAKAGKLLVELLKLAGTEYAPAKELQENTFDGVKTWYLRGPEGSTGIEPKYAIAGGRLVVAMDMLILRGALKTMNAENLAASAWMQEAAKGAGGKLGAVFVYVNWGQLYTAVFDFGAHVLKLANFTSMVRNLGIDVNLLPTPGAITKHLFPSLAIVQATPNGVVLTSRSPMPSAEVIAPPVAAFAAVVATFAADFATAEPTPAPAGSGAQK